MDYENFCNKCKNRTFNLQKGILCSLTNEKPSFDTECPDFVLDPSAPKKRKTSMMARDGLTGGQFVGSLLCWPYGLFLLFSSIIDGYPKRAKELGILYGILIILGILRYLWSN